MVLYDKLTMDVASFEWMVGGGIISNRNSRVGFFWRKNVSLLVL